jgi:predicted deacylase
VAKAESPAPLTVNGVDIGPAERLTVDLPVARLYTHTPLTMPVHVVRGRKPGPCLFVCAAIHGDEINGVEIVRRLLASPLLKQLRGTLMAIPIVNVYGFIQHSRYLPDRRDLNRSFPGSDKGSLTARVASLFMREIVSHCTHGIDIHTGAIHRANLPQIRARLDDPGTLDLARAFGVPVLLNSDTPDGSLREAAAARGVPVLLYEAGEALRFDEVSVRAGLRGVLGVLRALSMLPAGRKAPRSVEPLLARSSTWVRAPGSGVLRTSVRLGARVRRGDTLGMIADPFGERELTVSAPSNGIVIGRLNLPLVNEGEALFHIAHFERTAAAARSVETFQAEHALEESLLDEPPPA